jgi:exoribonuclease-2
MLKLANTFAISFLVCAGFATAFSPLQPLNGVAVRSLSFPSRTSTSIAALADDIQPGQIVEYRYSSSKGTGSGSAFGLGAIIEPDGKRNWKILTSTGLSRSVPPKDIRHRVPKGRVSTTQSQAEADIAAHEDAATDALAHDKVCHGADVVSVWEMLVEDGESETDLETLAELIVGDASSRACYAARAVLTVGVESWCFKEGRSDNMFVPRPPDIVEALRRKARAEAEVEAKWEAIRERIQAACSGSSEAVTAFCIQDETEEVRTAFEAIKRLGCLVHLGPEELAEHEEMAAGTGEAEELASARTFLKQILGRKGTAEAARTLLVQTGVWHVHQNLDVLRQRIPMEFSPNLEQLAAELAASPPPDIDADKRLDLTHLLAFAIDEASTREIDDALSVEILELPGVEGGPVHKRWRLWVHIADPTRYVALDTPLDREARRRSSSLYLPTGTVPMFPISIAAGPLCLQTGETSCALSVGVMLSADGGIDTETPPVITPSLVRTTRLTYDEVDELLDPFRFERDDTCANYDNDEQKETIECIRKLQWASEQRLGWRKAGGSLESIGPYELPDMSVKAWPSSDEPDGWGVSVMARERHTASRIVTELMLLANEAIATYGYTNDVPMAFRSQEREEIDDLELDCTPEGPCRAWLAIRSTRRSQISSTAQPHGGLGLDYYVQATSPVRRYSDLALHHQLKAHLRGDVLPFPALNTGDADADGGGGGASEIIRFAQDGGKVAKLLERSANDYWLREFLRRRAGQPVSVLVLSGDRRRTDLYKLLLTELGGIITYTSSRPLALGSQFELSPSPTGEFN